MGYLISGLGFIMHGGFMMYPLLLSAFVALTVIIERFYVFQTRFRTPTALVHQALARVREHKLEEAQQIGSRIHSPVGEVLLEGLKNFHRPAQSLELSMSNSAESWIPRLEKRVEIIDTIITAAPLMGLLGTITGMMGSFQVLSQKGVNEPNAITGGVAEALIATATGLVIALFCLFAYNYFLSRTKSIIYEMEGVASTLEEIHESERAPAGPSAKP